MDRYLNLITPAIEHFHMLGYGVAFAAALLETALVVGLLLPGSTLLLLLGALSAGGHLGFAGVLWFAVAGAIIGDNFNFWLGKRYGRHWATNGLWGLGPEHFAKAQGFFDRHGASSVFLGRFIPSVKEFAPVVAGMVGMRQRTFLFWNVLGAVGWGLQWVGAGYLFGHSIQLAQAWMSRAALALALLLIFGVLLWWLQRLVLRQGMKLWRVLVSLGRSLRRALAANPWVRRWQHRHPTMARFLALRMDRTHAQGLPLSLAVLTLVYVLALFVGIVEDVVTSDVVVSADHAAAQLVAALRPDGWVEPMAAFTNLGAPSVIAALLVTFALLLWWSGLGHAITGLLVSVLGASLFGHLAKLAFQRPRPLEAVLAETSYAFPSGHATVAVAFYAFVGYLLIRLSHTWTARVRLFFATALLVLLIGLSRILLGVHYLSDVWAGFLVGTMWLIVGVSINEWLSTRGLLTWQAPRAAGRRWATGGLALLASAGVLVLLPTHDTPRRTPEPMAPTAIHQPLVQVLHAGPLRTTTTALGALEQPLSLALVAEDASALRTRLGQAGWQAADPPTLPNLLRLLREGARYGNAPLGPVFWNKRMNELAFVRQRPSTPGQPVETLRLWKTPWRIGSSQIFVGMARDQTFTHWRLLHHSPPDVDAATDRVVVSLQISAAAVAVCRTAWVAPSTGRYLLGQPFFTRGELQLVNLGKPTTAERLCGQMTGAP
ncbi:MAG: PA-phosphatase [Betaproteobacteria bacterium HGW-Betaproteobacteria-15]|nr:MAG: PA-phosphatase [Betaproteobacteria bacterium HGW-Betaproteobacteria-15]